MSFENRPPEKQADAALRMCASIGKPRHGDRKNDRINGLGTLERYRTPYVAAARFMREEHDSTLHKMTPDHARVFLERRSVEITQKSLNNDHRALTVFMRNRDNDRSIVLDRVTSEITREARARAYSEEQVRAIVERQRETAALSTRLAAAAGLRAAEVYTLQRIEERSASGHRTWREDRFAGRESEHERYTVKGKGGLVREVAVPAKLARELESRRLDEPRLIRDRKLPVEIRYDLVGGQRLSQQFSRDSRSTLTWSEGVHGLRHSYAQTRMEELGNAEVRYLDALAIVSQEMGHFRPEITMVYLR